MKCTYCENEAVMELTNLKNKVTKRFCKGHFGEFITDGQSRVQEQFLDVTMGPRVDAHGNRVQH
jgi:hypothetical protein